jgi:hypothetical protein
MIYAEYVDRDRFMPMEIFRRFADQSSWTAPEDGMVGNFGRTMRMGPTPAYLCFWQCKDLERMDEWEAHFHTPEAAMDKAEQATFQAIHLVRGGCYDEVIEGPPVNRDGLICIEYFGAPESVPDEELGAHFTMRAARHREADLNFVLRRIGRLGPNPGCLAVWTFESYKAMQPFQRTSLDDDPYRPEETGIYRWMGKDIL